MGTELADQLDGGGGDDVIYGLGGDDTISGDSGNDEIRAGTGNNDVSDGLGDDLVDLSENSVGVNYTTDGGADTVFGTAFDDTIVPGVDMDPVWFEGRGGDDELVGTLRQDRLDGGDGNDILDGGLAFDFLFGGAGNDFFLVRSGLIVGGDGTDTLLVVTAADTVDILSTEGLVEVQHGAANAFAGGTEQVRIALSFPDATLTVHDLLETDVDDIFVIEPAGATVVVNGSNVADQISLALESEFEQTVTTRWGKVAAVDLSGNLMINGLGGDDVIVASPDVGILVSLDGGAGNDFLSGGNTLLGSDGDDTLVGSAGDDLIDGGAGNDTIVGNGGTDTISGGSGADTIHVLGTEGNDVISLALSGADLLATVNGLTTTYLGIGAAAIERVLVQGLDGDDTISVVPLSDINLVVDGGGPGAGGPGTSSDVLSVNVPAGARVTQGADSQNGTIDGTGAGDIDLAGLEFISIVSATADSTLTVRGTDDSDTMAVQPIEGGPSGLVWVNDGPVINFNSANGNFAALALQGRFGDDTFSITPMAGVAISAEGGDPTASDHVVVNGTAGADTITFSPTAADAATVQINALGLVSISAAESVVINGLGGGDGLTIMTPDEPFTLNAITLTPGDSPDSGSVRSRQLGAGGPLVPMDFTALGASGSLSFANAGGDRSDILELNGTAGDDRFDVSSSGQLQIFKANQIGSISTTVAIHTPGIEQVELKGLDGDDAFNVSGGLPFTQTVLSGGDPSASDAANIAGDGTAIIASIGTGGMMITGGGLGTVTLAGVELLELDAAGGNLTVLTTDGNDTLVVTPTGPDSATLDATGLVPRMAVRGGASLTVDLLDGSDTLVVEGSAGADLISVAAGQVSIAGRLAVHHGGAEALTIRGLEGNDTIEVSPSDIPVFVDGGDPIGTTAGDTLIVDAGGNPVIVEAGPESDEGGLVVGGSARVSYDHIEVLSVVNPGPVLILGTNGDDDITVIARDESTHALADGVQDLTVSVNDGPELLFIDVPQLFIDALSGDDDIVLRTPAPNGAEWDVDVTIAGGPPSAGASADGDRFVLETPGTDSIIFTPTASDQATILIDEPGNDSLITIGPFTLVLVPGQEPDVYVSSPGGIELFEYDGEAGDDSLAVMGTADADTFVHTPGAANDEGTLGNGSLLGVSYQNLGAAATLMVDAGAGDDALRVLGTTAGDFFRVLAGSGSVELNFRLAINQVGVERLVLAGLDGDDAFDIVATQPYAVIAVDGGNPSASDVLILEGTGGDESFAVDLPTSSISGLGGMVNFFGIEQVLMFGNGGSDTLAVLGTPSDDTINYTPTGPEAGNFELAGGNTHFSFVAISGTFSIDGQGGSADTVAVHGTNNHDVITIDSPARTVSVENAAGVVLKPFVLGAAVEVVHALGKLGNDTFLVIPAAATGLGPAPNFLPANLLVYVDGGPPGASDALVVAGPGGVPLAADLFAVVNRGRNAGEGVVRVFQDQPGAGNEPIQFPDIVYTDTEVVSPITFVNAQGDPNLLILGPDNYEPNEFRANAAFLGAASVHDVVNLSVFPNAFEHRFVVADQDWFRVVAQHTGTMDFQVYFQQIPEFLPGAGDLQIEVRDKAGNVIAGFGVNDFAGSPNADERRRIPVVAGETYYLQVQGALDTTVNAYNVSIVNALAPVPYDIELADEPAGTNSDTGRSQFDNVTFDSTPTIFLRLDDDILLGDLRGGGAGNLPPDNQVIPIPFRGSASPDLASYRVAIFDEVDTHSPVFMGFADQVGGQPGVYTFTFITPLADGSHFITAKVQMVDPSDPSNNAFGAVSGSLEIIVDTVAPPVFFGSAGNATDGLDPASDSGVPGQPATIVDRITNDSTPSFFGPAEADAIVRVFVDLNGNDTVDAGDLFIGQAVAVPLDGSNQFPDGQFNVTSIVDLNDPAFFALDGARRILITAEDLAGNVGAGEPLTIFIDTQGPRVDNVTVTGQPGFDLFGVKSGGTLAPTPLIHNLDIRFTDQPVRVDLGGADVFVYPAVNRIEAETAGNYRLVGDATGEVTIVSAVLTDLTAAGLPGLSTVTLTFAAPLPDDRFTLFVSESITDDPGNELDGEFGPVFETGDGSLGGDFTRRFTVDSRPEVGVYSSGSVSIDINGNFIFDPNNVDQVNRDLIFNLGFASDRLFAGNFGPAGGIADGFDKLGAYGFVAGKWRFLLDFDNDSIPELNIVSTLQIDGLPIAGNFSAAHSGDEIGIFDGKTWYLDTNGNNDIDFGDLVIAGGNMRGLPIVGDFDGDGRDDLGTFAADRFFFDLAADGLDGNADASFEFRFDGVLERPVAADMDQDGIDDVGLWVPGRSHQDGALGEWFFLVSNDPTGAKRVTGTVNTLAHPFSTVPFGADLFMRFGDQFALPLVGNFDPPISNTGNPTGWLQTLYTDVLGREASFQEWSYWAGAVRSGMSYSQVAQSFLFSTERRAGIIDDLYREYLGRPSDGAGVNYWIGVWNAHGGPEHVQAGIIGSAEYYRTAGGTDAAWVTALYRNILNREVDQAGLDHWVRYIRNHSKQSVVLGFVTSDEYRLGLITGWFSDYLGRTLDTAGAQYWLNQMKRGVTQESIQIGILASAEYRNNA
ncbi:MAG: DUF4214 domain-containing protein [Pirellulales bacterium]